MGDSEWQQITLDYQAGVEAWLEKLNGQKIPTETEAKPNCLVHRPIKYVGFTETYDYCEICDLKFKDGKWVK